MGKYIFLKVLRNFSDLINFILLKNIIQKKNKTLILYRLLVYYK
jgi:hypothetical protein